MENTVSRIKQYIDYKGVSVRRFEESVSFSNGSFASQFKNNKTIGVDKVENILHVYPDINPDWLLTGRGEMLRSEQVEQLQNPTIIYKSDPKDAEIIAAKDLIIKRDAELIAMLQCRIRSLEEIKTFRVQDLDIARSADTTTITGTKSIHK